MKQVIFNCLNCGNEHTSSNRYSCKAMYCSQTCQHQYNMKVKIENGTATARMLKKHLLQEYGEKCWCCEITEWNEKSIVFELEHVDGNSENNELSNLSILCPNCHSQTDTYKNKNKGNGRHSRRVRYSEGKSY